MKIVARSFVALALAGGAVAAAGAGVAVAVGAPGAESGGQRATVVVEQPALRLPQATTIKQSTTFKPVATTRLSAAAGASTTSSTTAASTTTTEAPAVAGGAEPVTTPTSAPARVGDDSSTRRVNLAIAGLVALGVLVAALTVWFWLATKPIPPALEALDAMSKRRWLKSSHARREAVLHDVHVKLGTGEAVQ